ncbi:glycosyl transferase LafA [Streptococcus sp. HSISB1]|nr:glycosyl transferase LafA [Streptococcus sp. HSISB1]
MANAILDAIENTPKMDEKAYQAKMYAISAEHFGKSVYAFYLDVLISAKNKKKEKFSLTVRRKREKTSVKIAHSAIKLPAEAAKATVKTSAKVFKAPKRLINSIRDFLN